MKKNLIVTLVAALGTIMTAAAHEKKAGPNGGRLITEVQPHAEFLIMPDRKVKIIFVDQENKPVAAGGQIVTAITGDRSSPVKLVFTKSGDFLVSDNPIPEGASVPTVVQIKTSPEAKTVVAKFNVNMANCPGCNLPEYACTCDH